QHTARPYIYTLSLHDALPISGARSFHHRHRFCHQSSGRRLDGNYGEPVSSGNCSIWTLIVLSSPALFTLRLILSPMPCVRTRSRSEEHTSELQSRGHLVCRLL